MKVLLLAGGFGTRISEESGVKPKPMLDIGGKPIIWHIMKQYSHYGYNEFVILLGYKGHVIKDYFSNYYLYNSDVTIDTAKQDLTILDNKSEDWKITLVETGLHTMTGGRIKRAQKYVGNEPFMLTYGDGVSNVNIDELVAFHKSHGSAITMTSVQPEGRFGALEFAENNRIAAFREKPKGDGSWINGGFFVCQPEVFDYIQDGDETIFEQGPLDKLAADGKMYSYKHSGFWKCMDTLRDKNKLNSMWDSGEHPWKVWS